MSLKKRVLLIAATMFVIGALLLVFGDTRGPEPKLECVDGPGKPTSGFVSDDCPDGTTIESQQEWFSWNSEPRYGRIVGLGIVALSLATAVTGAFIRKKREQ